MSSNDYLFKVPFPAFIIKESHERMAFLHSLCLKTSIAKNSYCVIEYMRYAVNTLY